MKVSRVLWLFVRTYWVTFVCAAGGAWIGKYLHMGPH